MSCNVMQCHVPANPVAFVFQRVGLYCGIKAFTPCFSIKDILVQFYCRIWARELLDLEIVDIKCTGAKSKYIGIANTMLEKHAQKIEDMFFRNNKIIARKSQMDSCCLLFPQLLDENHSRRKRSVRSLQIFYARSYWITHATWCWYA